MQTGYLPRSKIVLYDTSIWRDFDKRMKGLAELGTISKDDLDLYVITDDLEEAYEILKRQVRV